VIRHSGNTGKFKIILYVKRQKYFQRITQKIAEIIKNNIPQPSAQQYGYNHPVEIVFDMLFLVTQFFVLNAIIHQHESKGKRHNVHQSVIAKLKRTDGKEYRRCVFRQMLPPVYKISHAGNSFNFTDLNE